ncbi:hypothetical protein pEaSNUABM38_00234 [Erwinia phage pEa_SNUABM_38]|nr:hypothetical protein pEaSNUABM38_00234 [Erwinia phage pEa_SNUABM_38]
MLTHLTAKYIYFKDKVDLLACELDYMSAVNWGTIKGHHPKAIMGTQYQYLLGQRKDGELEIIPMIYSGSRHHLNIDPREHDVASLFSSLLLVQESMVLEISHPIDTTIMDTPINQQEFTNAHTAAVDHSRPQTFMFIDARSWMTDLMEVITCHRKHRHLHVNVSHDYLDPGGAVMRNLDQMGFVGRRSFTTMILT